MAGPERLRHARREPDRARADIDETIDQAFAPIARAFSNAIFFSVRVGDADVPLIVLWLVAGAVFFTAYLRFVNLRGFAHALRLVRGDYADPDDPGEVSHFQALATAISGTVGVGNIAHVAIAISVGGPGAAFWMAVAGLLGMASKFAECTLGSEVPTQELPDGSGLGRPHVLPRPRVWPSAAAPRLGQAAMGTLLRGVRSWWAPWGSAACSSRTRPTCSSSTSTGDDGELLRPARLAVRIAGHGGRWSGVVIVGGIRSIARRGQRASSPSWRSSTWPPGSSSSPPTP